jgi:hypothetical protein
MHIEKMEDQLHFLNTEHGVVLSTILNPGKADQGKYQIVQLLPTFMTLTEQLLS